MLPADQDQNFSSPFNIEFQVLNTFENMENGAVAPKEQMLYFPYYFHIHSISKGSKKLLRSKWLALCTLDNFS